jgi:hypothetical protein
MRRKDREVSDMEEILKIIKKCDVCRIALFDEEYPYIIPMNFGLSHEDGTLKLYFHGAKEGTKLTLMERNPKAAFEMDCSHKLVTGEEACDYSMEYESVCGNGTIKILGPEQTVQALDILMKQYSEDTSFQYKEAYLTSVAVMELTVEHIYGKRKLTKA